MSAVRQRSSSTLTCGRHGIADTLLSVIESSTTAMTIAYEEGLQCPNHLAKRVFSVTLPKGQNWRSKNAAARMIVTARSVHGIETVMMEALVRRGRQLPDRLSGPSPDQIRVIALTGGAEGVRVSIVAPAPNRWP